MANKPRWEIKYEKYKAEEPKYRTMRATIAKLEASMATLEGGEVKVKGDFKTKEEYQNALNAAKSKIQEEIKTQKSKIDLIKKELAGYENFKNNQQQIENIFEYRKDLEHRLMALPKDTRQEIEEKRQELSGVEQRVTQYQKEIEGMKKQLKNNIAEEERQILLFTLKTKMEAMEPLQTRQSDLDMQIGTLEEQGKGFDKIAEDKRITYERKIAKCNIIAANLMKGKSLLDFDLKVEPEGKRFTSPDGKLFKTTKASRNLEKSKKEKAKEDETEYDNAYNNGYDDGIQDKEYNEEYDFASSKDSKEGYRDGFTDGSNYRKYGYNQKPFFKKLKDKIVGIRDFDDYEEEFEEEEKNLVGISDFEKKHPKLAKVFNFFKNIGNKIFKNKEEDKKLDDDNLKDYNKEDRTLYEITQKGKERTFKERLAEMNQKNGYYRPTAKQKENFHNVDKQAKPHREYKDNEER